MAIETHAHEVILHLQDRPPLDIRQATVQRRWMDRTADR